MVLFRELESDLEVEIVKLADSTGWRVRKLVSPGRRGEADRTFAKNGELRILEIKRYGETPSQQQLRRLQEWRDDGFRAEWCDNMVYARAFLLAE